MIEDYCESTHMIWKSLLGNLKKYGASTCARTISNRLNEQGINVIRLLQSHICLLKTFSNVWSSVTSMKPGPLKIWRRPCSQPRRISKHEETYWKALWVCNKYIMGVPCINHGMGLNFCARNGWLPCPRRKSQCKWLHRHHRGETYTVHRSSISYWEFCHYNKTTHLVTRRIQWANFDINVSTLSFLKFAMKQLGEDMDGEERASTHQVASNSPDLNIIEPVWPRLKD